MKYCIFIGLSLLFFINCTPVNAATIDYNSSQKMAKVQHKKSKSSWFQRFVQKRLKKKITKQLKRERLRKAKSPKASKAQKRIKELDMDAFWIGILSLLSGIGAFVFVLLTQLASVGLGLLILYWVLGLIFGIGGFWLGIEAWRESRYSDRKSTTRWIAFIGMMLSGAILYGILQPFLFLF